MAKEIRFQTFQDSRGCLTVIEKEIGFEIKRVYYIYDLDQKPRGFHRHKETIQCLICISGSCKVLVNDGVTINTYLLDNREVGLLLFPIDFHIMSDFADGTVLLVIASEFFNVDDYIYENYD